MSNATDPKLTPSQRKTLDYVRENGRVPAGVIGNGYSHKSAAALCRKGLLVEVTESVEINGKSIPLSYYDVPEREKR